MTDRKTGYRVTIVAEVPCDVENEDARTTTMLGIEAVRRKLEHGATIIRFAVEMVREDDETPAWVEPALKQAMDSARVYPSEFGEVPPNPDLDAAAAVGMMGKKYCSHCGNPRGNHAVGCPLFVAGWRPDICPTCHTPGGEHAEGCEVREPCDGEGKEHYNDPNSPPCPDCSGAGRVLKKEMGDG